jgi:hypothetical protein
MIPIRDDAPRYSTPFITYFLVALNIVVFLFEVSLQPRVRQILMYQFGFVPANLTGLLGNQHIAPAAAVVPIFTSMFLHASWLHLFFNMWALWIFGDNVEDYLGHFRYLLFYFLSGIGAAALHTVLNPNSQIPSVGASGAIAGVMGAYMVLFSSARVLTMVLPPFFFFWLPAWLVLGYWFVGQFLSGAATAITFSNQTQGGGVAFWAHVGGFLAGIAMIKLFPTRPPRYRFGTR